MIVFVTITGYDNTFPVLADRMENGFIRVDGKQLRLVAPEEDKPYINTEASYHMHINAYKRKCYDCFQFNGRGKEYEPSVKTDYILRCEGYCPKTGSPGFKPSEAIAAGVPTWKVLAYTKESTGLLHIKPRMLKAC